MSSYRTNDSLHVSVCKVMGAGEIIRLSFDLVMYASGGHIAYMSAGVYEFCPNLMETGGKKYEYSG